MHVATAGTVPHFLENDDIRSRRNDLRSEHGFPLIPTGAIVTVSGIVTQDGQSDSAAAAD